MIIPAPDTLALYGQSGAGQALSHAWRSERMPHAWLLTGPPGIGKATLARGFAQAVLSRAAVPGREIEAVAIDGYGTHADLLVVARSSDERRERLRSEIVLEDVRPIREFLQRTAASGGWRVVLVDDAERLNRNAANALLKLIEAPPSRVLILLICAAPGRLPGTIRSRCRQLRLDPLDDEAMDQVLQRRLPELRDAERGTLVRLSDGSPGRALSLATGEGLTLSGLVQDVLSRQDWHPGLWCYDVVESVLRHESGFATFLGLLSAAISTTIRQQARNGHVPADSLLHLVPTDRWAGICAEITRFRSEAESLNLDKRQALLACLDLLSGS